MPARLLLTIAIGLVAALAVIWFISSFFFLEDENPRGSLQAPSYAAANIDTRSA